MVWAYRPYFRNQLRVRALACVRTYARVRACMHAYYSLLTTHYYDPYYLYYPYYTFTTFTTFTTLTTLTTLTTRTILSTRFVRACPACVVRCALRRALCIRPRAARISKVYLVDF